MLEHSRRSRRARSDLDAQRANWRYILNWLELTNPQVTLKSRRFESGGRQWLMFLVCAAVSLASLYSAWQIGMWLPWMWFWGGAFLTAVCASVLLLFRFSSMVPHEATDAIGSRREQAIRADNTQTPPSLQQPISLEVESLSITAFHPLYRSSARASALFFTNEQTWSTGLVLVIGTEALMFGKARSSACQH
jgi:hypothetical protein